MNTNPDETKLALWLDDELNGDELAAMDAWAAQMPEQLDARRELRAYRKTMSAALPASEELPYPDFFLSRVNQGIRDLRSAEHLAAPASAAAPFWKSWFLPVAACAGMVLAFGIGRQSFNDRRPMANAPTAKPAVYTPEEGVDAEWFSSSGAGATVIVLQGVSAIPDSTDFSETVYVPTASEADRTAGQRNEGRNPGDQ